MAGGATDAATGSGGAEDDYNASRMDGAEGDVVAGAMDQSELVAPGGVRAGDPGVVTVRGDMHDGELSDGDGVVLIEDELDGFIGAPGSSCDRACGEKREDAANSLQDHVNCSTISIIHAMETYFELRVFCLSGLRYILFGSRAQIKMERLPRCVIRT